MLSLSRVLLVVSFVAGLCALIARFVQIGPLFMIRPDTWLQATGVFLLFAIAAGVLAIAELMTKGGATGADKN